MKTKKTPESVLKIVKESFYDSVRFVGRWRGYDVYEPFFSDGIPRFLGFPQYILFKEGESRWTADREESLSVMKSIGRIFS